MKDITGILKVGGPDLSLKSTQQATVFPGRQRAFKTGVKADPEVVKACETLILSLEHDLEIEFLSDPHTDEVLVVLNNYGKEAFLVEEGMELCSAMPKLNSPAVEEVTENETSPSLTEVGEAPAETETRTFNVTTKNVVNFRNEVQ